MEIRFALEIPYFVYLQNTSIKYLVTQFSFSQLCQLTHSLPVMGLSRKVIEKKDSKTVFAMGFVASPLNGRPRCIREHEQTARADKWRDESSISTRWNKRGQHDTTNTRGGRKRSTRVSRIIFFLRIRHNSRHWWLVTRRKSMDEIRM